ncbi:MAG: hypothetical protein EBZ49_00300 [Proteobacteria bacterium]|nr:hypothetical protein [Pseudomonadota bacterium]
MLITIVVKQLVPDEALHPDDKHIRPNGVYHYYVEGRSLQDSEKQALEKFYWSTPIRCPSDFSVEATVYEPVNFQQRLFNQSLFTRG